MRLHLVIQRHGLPVTRILWTTTSPSLEATTSYRPPAASSAIASTRTPNASFANGGYLIAQLLEDVNEVVPLETEPRLLGDKSSGQWGLEDYVVEVAGSECLHFMEVEGLLRDGDEVVIRALQISDLRARRVSGRHQISTDGRHLIDGVPFGRPYLKRSTSSRPAISIPPRKKRRTLYSSGGGYEEEDTEWAPVEHNVTGKELSALPDNFGEDDEEQDADYFEDYHEAQPDEDEDTGDGTVIRHPVEEFEDARVSETDADVSEVGEPEDLTEELQGLKEDMHLSGLEVGGMDEEQPSRLRFTKSPAEGVDKSPSQASRITDESPRARLAKSVRFERKGEQASPASHKAEKSPASAKDVAPEVPSSDENISSDSTSDSDSSDVSSDEEEEKDESSQSDDSTSDSDDSSSDSSSESEDETSIFETAPDVTKVNPPGQGSQRTKKSNQRNKLRRRLSKLKEFGVLPEQADFNALREWETTNGNWNFGLENNKPSATTGEKRQAKEQEQQEFEAKRQRLLRDLESGGVDIDIFNEKENVPTQDVEKELVAQPEEDTTMDNAEPLKKRSLDVASTKRLLFGSLGVRTPRSKEDEEATRKKLAGKANNFQSQRKTEEEEQQAAEESENDLDENWQDKLIIRATECVFDDIELTAPPFPFEQRWDDEADAIIRKRKGWGKKRKRKQRIQVYDEPEEESWYDTGYENGYDNGDYENGELQLNYDGTEQQVDEGPTEMDGVEETTAEVPGSTKDDDLPRLPDDTSSIPDLAEDELKKQSIIAFKQLDMSKETNWQPRVSEYRVAEIHDVYEDGIISVQLAKRDRKQKKEDYDDDEYDGPRRYSGFEMPGFEDDEEDDDGFREVAFPELIEPKLLRAAAAADGAAEEGDAQEVSNSPVVEESVENPPSVSVVVEVPSVLNESPPSAQNPDLHTQNDGSNDSVDSVEGGDIPANVGDDGGEHDSPVKSPEFSGFQSPRTETEPATKPSPPREVSESTDAVAGRQNGEDAPEKNEQSTGEWSVPPNTNTYGDEGPMLDSNDLQPLSSPRSLVSFNGLLDQAFEDTDIAISNTPPVERKGEKGDDSPSHPSHDSYVPNPFYDIDKAHEQRQQRESEKADDSVNYGDDEDTIDAEPSSFMGFSSSPTPRRSRRNKKSKKKPAVASQEASLISSVPESQWQDPRERGSTQPPASQVSEVVDLTQSSPASRSRSRSPEGSDDHSKSQQLPQGPGWVKKNLPKSQRRVQTLKEVSSSPSTSVQGRGRASSSRRRKT